MASVSASHFALNESSFSPEDAYTWARSQLHRNMYTHITFGRIEIVRVYPSPLLCLCLLSSLLFSILGFTFYYQFLFSHRLKTQTLQTLIESLQAQWQPISFCLVPLRMEHLLGSQHHQQQIVKYECIHRRPKQNSRNLTGHCGRIFS